MIKTKHIELLFLSTILLFNQTKEIVKNFIKPEFKGTFVYNKDTFLWTETFGDSSNPCILLIHGAGSHRKFWPDTFCKKLAQHNFFVIRYDQRDSGYSKRYTKNQSQSLCYSFNDLTNDACTILDYYTLKKAHVIGHSMGGCIAAGLTALHSDRLLTTIILGSGDVFNTEEHKKFNLSKRSEDLFKQLRSYKPTGWYGYDKATLLEKTKLVHGNYTIDESLFDDYTQEFYSFLQKRPSIKNHIVALQTKPKTLVSDLNKSLTKTLILHGTHDTIIPYDWAEMLSKQMTNATFISLVGAGHMYFNQDLWNLFEQEITAFILKSCYHSR